jgi:hypothetical protein
MAINRDVIAQAITLASIIAGFSFAITAQIALRAKSTPSKVWTPPNASPPPVSAVWQP